MVRLIFIALLGFTFSAFGQGSSVGKGGDTIKCQPSSLNDFAGDYTLDYLLESNSGEFKIASDLNFNKMKMKLMAYLGPEQFELAQSFALYSNSLFKKNIASGRVWTKSTTPLYDIKDEEIIKQIPENCLVLKAGSYVLQLNQTVIRQTIKDYVEYYFDDAILTAQQKQNPIQFSFFMVHEWLWDFTRNIESLRKLNWLLHSNNLEKISKADFKLFLERINFGILDLPVCERITIIRNLFSKNCAQVTKLDLLTAESLALDYSLRHPRPGDLYGFSKAKTLILKGVTTLPPRFFNSLYQLETLDLSNTLISGMSEMILTDLKYLKSIKLNLALSKNPYQLKLIKAALPQVEIKVAE